MGNLSISQSTARGGGSVKKIEVLKSALGEGGGDLITIATRQELNEFISDLSNIGALYKAHLSPNVFDSAAYKERIRGHSQPRRRLRIRDGYESFGVAKGTKVYELEKDIFTFFF